MPCRQRHSNYQVVMNILIIGTIAIMSPGVDRNWEVLELNEKMPRFPELTLELNPSGLKKDLERSHQVPFISYSALQIFSKHVPRFYMFPLRLDSAIELSYLN